jgi:hypothetical protein
MLGVFIDEYGLNPYIFNGGKFRYAMDWLRILLLVLLCTVSGISIFTTKNNN